MRHLCLFIFIVFVAVFAQTSHSTSSFDKAFDEQQAKLPEAVRNQDAPRSEDDPKNSKKHLLPSENCNGRRLAKLWENIKLCLTQIINLDIREKYAKFGEFIKQHLDDAIETAQGKHGGINILIMLTIFYSADLPKDAAAEALKFFEPHNEDLGDFVERLKENLKEIN